MIDNEKTAPLLWGIQAGQPKTRTDYYSFRAAQYITLPLTGMPHVLPKEPIDNPFYKNHLTEKTQQGYFSPVAPKWAARILTLIIEADAQSHHGRLFLCPEHMMSCYRRPCRRAERFAAVTVSCGSENPAPVYHSLSLTKDDGYTSTTETGNLAMSSHTSGTPSNKQTCPSENPLETQLFTALAHGVMPYYTHFDNLHEMVDHLLSRLKLQFEIHQDCAIAASESGSNINTIEFKTNDLSAFFEQFSSQVSVIATLNETLGKQQHALKKENKCLQNNIFALEHALASTTGAVA